MTKPHEEEWYQSSPGTVRVRYGRNELVGEFAHAKREKLATAAPRMARALLKRLSPEAAPCLCHLTTPDTCDNCADRTMLREAGVL